MNRVYKILQRRSALYSLFAVLGGSLLCAASANAGNTVTVSIMGSVFSGPACEVTGNTSSYIEVNFGDSVMTNMIDGVNYKRPIPLGLSCTGNPSSVSFTFSGNSGAPFDNTLLSTNISDLGLRLLKPDGSALNLGEDFSMAYTGAVPNLTVVPVQNPGSTLPAGHFGTSAILTVNVQ